MNPTAFLMSLGVAVAAPLIVLHYLIPALRRAASHAPCRSSDSLGFWLASLRWLAVLGTLILVLSFGEFRDGVDLLSVLRRTLWLVSAGLFLSIAVMAHAVWRTLLQRTPEPRRQAHSNQTREA